MAIQKLDSNVQLEQPLPNSEDIIKMDMIEGWSHCSEDQKAYLCVYFQLYPKKMKACMQSGTSQAKFNKWLNDDMNFIRILETIEQIHMEELEAQEYKEAYTDKTVRGRVIDGGKKSSGKSVTNVLVHESTIDKYLN